VNCNHEVENRRRRPEYISLLLLLSCENWDDIPWPIPLDVSHNIPLMLCGNGTSHKDG